MTSAQKAIRNDIARQVFKQMRNTGRWADLQATVSQCKKPSHARFWPAANEARDLAWAAFVALPQGDQAAFASPREAAEFALGEILRRAKNYNQI